MHTAAVSFACSHVHRALTGLCGARTQAYMAAGEIASDMVTRAGEAATRVMRIFMHLLLHLHGSSTGQWQGLQDVLRPPARAADGNSTQAERSVRAWLEDRVLSDWAALQEMFGLDEEQVMIALVMVACRLHLVPSSLRGFDSEASRSAFEVSFEQACVLPIFNTDVAATVIQVQSDIDPAGTTDAPLLGRLLQVACRAGSAGLAEWLAGWLAWLPAGS